MTELVRFENSDRLTVAKIGVYLLGSATIFAGILNLIWRDFDPGHQPIAALGVHIPDRAIFAYITGVWMIVSGAAILWRRTVRTGAIATAVIYSIFGLFSLPRLYTMPHRYGFHVTLVLGVFGEMLQQFIVVAGCIVLYVSFAPASRWTAKAPLVARLAFGLSGVLLCFAHFINPQGPVHMIPPRNPLQRTLLDTDQRNWLYAGWTCDSQRDSERTGRSIVRVDAAGLRSYIGADHLWLPSRA